MGDSKLVKKFPKEVQELVSSGAYNLFHSLNKTGFIIVTKMGKNLLFDENGIFLSETKISPDSNFEQIYTDSPEEWLLRFKSRQWINLT